MKKSEAGGVGGICPVSSKVEMVTKVWEKSLGLEKGWSKGGKDGEVKLLEVFLARCQKSRDELELERFWHYLLMKEFLVSWKIGLDWLRSEI